MQNFSGLNYQQYHIFRYSRGETGSVEHLVQNGQCFQIAETLKVDAVVVDDMVQKFVPLPFRETETVQVPVIHPAQRLEETGVRIADELSVRRVLVSVLRLHEVEITGSGQVTDIRSEA